MNRALKQGSRPKGFRGEALPLSFRGEKHRFRDPFLGRCMRRPPSSPRSCVNRPTLYCQFVVESGLVRRLKSERHSGGRFAALFQGWGIKQKAVPGLCVNRPLSHFRYARLRGKHVARKEVVRKKVIRKGFICPPSRQPRGKS